MPTQAWRLIAATWQDRLPACHGLCCRPGSGLLLAQALHLTAACLASMTCSAIQSKALHTACGMWAPAATGYREVSAAPLRATHLVSNHCCLLVSSQPAEGPITDYAVAACKLRASHSEHYCVGQVV